MLLPDIGPHFFAGENGGRAYSIEIDEDELSDGHAELFETKEPQLLGLLHNDPISDMLQLIVTEVQQIFLVYVSLAVFSYDLDVVKIKGSFRLISENLAYERPRLVLTPEKREYFVYYVRLEIFMGVTKLWYLNIRICLASLRIVTFCGPFLHKMIVMLLIAFIIQKTWVQLWLIYWQCLLLERQL